MATYVAAWAIVPDDYGILRATSRNGKSIRVLARKDAVNKGLLDYALDVATKVLDFFENEYFSANPNGVPPKIGKTFIYLL